MMEATLKERIAKVEVKASDLNVQNADLNSKLVDLNKENFSFKKKIASLERTIDRNRVEMDDGYSNLNRDTINDS
jgi:chromosome segregation ATPase